MVANAEPFPELKELPKFPLERFEELIHSNINGVYLSRPSGRRRSRPRRRWSSPISTKAAAR